MRFAAGRLWLLPSCLQLFMVALNVPTMIEGGHIPPKGAVLGGLDD